MNVLRTGLSGRAGLRPALAGIAPRPAPDRGRAGHVAGIGIVLVTGITIAAWTLVLPPWLAAVGIALTLFVSLKFATLRDHARGASPTRVFAYLACWPGMDAPTFLRADIAPPERPGLRELGFALAKLVLGFVLAGWTIAHAFTWPTRLVGLIGIASAIVTLHFGVFHVLSWLWRHAGIHAPPLMRAPLAATSLADFWGARWNTAFAALARRFILRPCARTIGAPNASLLVFLVSGVIHDLAISLPAGAGWGRPTLYFLLQGAGLALEKSAIGRRYGLGSGVRGRVWMLIFAAAPLPLLFHDPFLERVVAPLFRTLKEVL